MKKFTNLFVTVLMFVTMFRVIEASSAQALSQNVERHLRSGWRLHGIMQISNGRFYQAVVK